MRLTTTCASHPDRTLELNNRGGLVRCGLRNAQTALQGPTAPSTQRYRCVPRASRHNDSSALNGYGSARLSVAVFAERLNFSALRDQSVQLHARVLSTLHTHITQIDVRARARGVTKLRARFTRAAVSRTESHAPRCATRRRTWRVRNENSARNSSDSRALSSDSLRTWYVSVVNGLAPPASLSYAQGSSR